MDFSNLFLVLSDGAEIAGPYETLKIAQEAGAVTIGYGVFLNNVVSFLIVAFAVFLVIKSLNKLKKEAEEEPKAPTDKECPHCCSTVPLKATRCGHCTSELSAQ